MNYHAWRISYQSSEQAAQAAYEALQQTREERDELSRDYDAEHYHRLAVERDRDALAADRADLIKELVACQNVLHQLAHAGECTPEYANDARDVLQRVTGGNPPMFDDRRTKEATPCPPR